jgi:UrcA family protein
MKTSIKNPLVTFASISVMSLGLLGGIHTAAADEPTFLSRTASISLTGLDLSTAAGAEAARERVHQAARKMCDQMRDDLDLSHRETYLECVDKTVARVKPNLEALITRVSAVRVAAVK